MRGGETSEELLTGASSSREKDHAPRPGASKGPRSLALLTSPCLALPRCVLGSRPAKLFEPAVLRAATWLRCLGPSPFEALSSRPTYPIGLREATYRVLRIAQAGMLTTTVINDARYPRLTRCFFLSTEQESDLAGVAQ